MTYIILMYCCHTYVLHLLCIMLTVVCRHKNKLFSYGVLSFGGKRTVQEWVQKNKIQKNSVKFSCYENVINLMKISSFILNTLIQLRLKVVNICLPRWGDILCAYKLTHRRTYRYIRIIPYTYVYGDLSACHWTGFYKTTYEYFTVLFHVP